MAVKVAVTAVSALSVTVQADWPEQAPPQPAKANPLAGAAVSETPVPFANEAVQAAPQLIPAGAEVTTPEPESATDSVCATAPPPTLPPPGGCGALPPQAIAQPTARNPARSFRMTTPNEAQGRRENLWLTCPQRKEP